MSRNRQESARVELETAAGGQRQCEKPDCVGPGLYPAPRGRDDLDNYFWFCKDHVREYNRAWNYYAGMSTDEIEAHVREDTVWRRPTWPLGTRGTESQPFGPIKTEDPFGLFGKGGRAREASQSSKANPNARTWRRGSVEYRALQTLDLEGPVTPEQIKNRYKELAKQHHPDANNGCKDAEERLKVINQAYTTLKKSFLTQ